MGLQLAVEACSAAWNESGTATRLHLHLPHRDPVHRPGLSSGHRQHPALGNLTALTAGKADNLVVTMTLPNAADNTFQGQSSAISFSFTGTQRGATSR